MNHQTGKLILISGPSGTGKSTVIARLMRLRSDVCFSVSATTRDPRPGEPQRRRERRHRQHELHAAQALRADPSGQIRLEQHRKQPQQQRRSGQQ